MGGRGTFSKLGNGRGKGTGYIYGDGMSFKEFQKANFDEMKRLHKQGGMQAVRDAYIETAVANESRNAHQISIDDAIADVREAIPDNIHRGWFVSADSGYKPKLVESIMQKEGALNAGWNIAYQNYLDFGVTDGEKPKSFEKWLNTPITLYRGTHGQGTVKSDEFSAYTPDVNIAKKFGDNITTIKIKPIDTWGSYQTNGEQEYLVPAKRLRK